MYKYSDQKTTGWLVWFLRGLLLLFFIALVSRVVDLQLIRGNYFRALSENNRIRRVVLPAPRGKILANNGEILVGNSEVTKEVDKENIITYKRFYALGKTFSHVSGYLGEATKEEVGKVDPKCPEKGPIKLGELVGRGGLEEYYNCQLKGIDGEKLFEVDARGLNARLIGERLPRAGSDINTNIDFGLQKETGNVFGDQLGAVVISDPKGNILALNSYSSFDPNDIAPSLTDETLPFFNRAIGGLFHPGSVFKVLVSLGALEDNNIDKDFRYTDTGKISVNEFDYNNWYFTQYGGTEGEIDLTKALARSTDTFFYKVGEFMGPDNIAKWSRRFGLEDKTNIDLPQEVKGLVPDPAWKKKVKKESWFLGNTYHYAIGQGDLAVTPLSLNQSVATLASGGKLCTPHIKKSDDNCRDLKISQDNIDLVKKGMEMVCATGGTGFTFFDMNPPALCKTGTAQVGVDEDTHAWFSVIWPADNPQVVATILVEKGGEGSKVAGPIARKLIDYVKTSKGL